MLALTRFGQDDKIRSRRSLPPNAIDFRDAKSSSRRGRKPETREGFRPPPSFLLLLGGGFRRDRGGARIQFRLLRLVPELGQHLPQLGGIDRLLE